MFNSLNKKSFPYECIFLRILISHVMTFLSTFPCCFCHSTALREDFLATPAVKLAAENKSADKSFEKKTSASKKSLSLLKVFLDKNWEKTVLCFFETTENGKINRLWTPQGGHPQFQFPTSRRDVMPPQFHQWQVPPSSKKARLAEKQRCLDVGCPVGS